MLIFSLNSAVSGQNWSYLDISGLYGVWPIRTLRYPDDFNRSLQCPDWPELTVVC